MNILDNSLLSAVFLILNVTVLVFSVVSYREKQYRLSFIALLIQSFIFLLYFFICYLAGNLFVLTVPQNFTSNLIYFSTILGSLINGLFGMKMYHQHRVISSIIIQLVMFFSAVLVATQLSDSAYNFYLQQKLKNKTEQAKGFNQTGDFEQTKSAGKDSLTTK